MFSTHEHCNIISFSVIPNFHSIRNQGGWAATDRASEEGEGARACIVTLALLVHVATVKIFKTD